MAGVVRSDSLWRTFIMANQYMVRVKNGPEAGPMSGELIRRMVRSGELGPDDLIRRDTSAQWMRVGAVPQLAAELPKPAPDELGLNEAATAGSVVAMDAPPIAAVQDAAPKLKRVDVVLLLVLSVVTFGIYGMIWFYGVLQSYRGITRRKEPNVEVLFWVYLGCAIVGGLTAVWVVGLFLLIGAAVVGGILLVNLLKDRASIAATLGGVPGLTDRNILLGFWIAGQVLWVCGIPFAIYQAFALASDHNKLVEAAKLKRPDLVESEGT